MEKKGRGYTQLGTKRSKGTPFLWQVSYFTLISRKAHSDCTDIENALRIENTRIAKESSGHLIQSLPMSRKSP